VEEQAEIACLKKKENRASRTRWKQKFATTKSSGTRKSCRFLVPAIGDQISFLNSYRRLPHGKASTDERHQTFD
jgi:predicted metal-binding protein